MGNLKDKIFDILFEPDEPTIVDGPLTDTTFKKKEVQVEKKPIEKNLPKEPIKGPDVKEVLYGKRIKQTSFIDYFPSKEGVKQKEKNELIEEKYEMRENVSPIFGVLNQKEKKKKTASQKDIKTAVVNSAPSEYVSIVISPIYGYDTAKANDARKKLDNKVDNQDEIIDEDVGSIFDEAPFDMPKEDETIKEIAREAIFESVVELNKGTNDFDEEVKPVQETKEETKIHIEELPEEELYTTEITKDEIQEAFNRVEKQKKFNNDSMSLFDLDEYVKDDANDDIFSDLGGND